MYCILRAEVILQIGPSGDSVPMHPDGALSAYKPHTTQGLPDFGSQTRLVLPAVDSTVVLRVRSLQVAYPDLPNHRRGCQPRRRDCSSLLRGRGPSG